jgi:predicted nucleic-acid-binding protein
MQMIGVDTNVLVRVVLDDHPQESAIAKKLLRKFVAGKKLFISSYALLEMIWVLKVQGRTRQTICEAVLDLLDSPGIVIGNREVVIAALEQYSNGKADFGDYLILHEGKSYDAPKLVSFDKAFYKEVSDCKPPSEYA